jgi:hypothetical protein
LIAAFRIGSGFMYDAFIEGHPSPERKNHHGDDEAPEIYFAAVPQRVIVIWRPFRAVQTVKKQKRVSGVDNGVDAFTQHSGTARPCGCAELCCGNQKISNHCRVNHFSRRKRRYSASSHEPSSGERTLFRK